MTSSWGFVPCTVPARDAPPIYPTAGALRLRGRAFYLVQLVHLVFFAGSAIAAGVWDVNKRREAWVRLLVLRSQISFVESYPPFWGLLIGLAG